MGHRQDLILVSKLCCLVCWSLLLALDKKVIIQECYSTIHLIELLYLVFSDIIAKLTEKLQGHLQDLQDKILFMSRSNGDKASTLVKPTTVAQKTVPIFTHFGIIGLL